MRYLWALAAAGTLAAVAPSVASSHREAPLITEDPVADNTDVYVFVNPDDPSQVNLIANWIPFQEPAGGPNFYNFGEDVLYQIHVDNDGDAEPDVTYEWRFDTRIQNPDTFLYNTGPITSIDDPDFNFRQFYTLSVVRNGVHTELGTGLPVPPNNIGPRSTPNYEAVARQGIIDVGSGITTFAGQRDEGFYVDIAAPFDLFGLRPFNDLHKVIPLPKEPGVDSTGGFNVNSIALQVPKALLTQGGDGSGIIGVYAQTKRRQTRVLNVRPGDPTPIMSGRFVNVSRLANPLINELVIPLGMKDLFNASDPSEDAQFLPYVLDPEPARLIEGLYPIDVPDAPRQDIATIFLTGLPGLNKPPSVKPSDMIRLNTNIAPTAPAGRGNKLGVLGGDNAGYPNGRRVEDDVVDIELRALAGATPFTPAFNRSPNNLLGDGVNDNDRPYMTTFPYLATPWPGYGHERDHHKVGSLSPQPAGPGPAPTTPASTSTTAPSASTTSTAPGATTTTIRQIPGCQIRRPNVPPGFTLPSLPPGCSYV